jgi:hypothetical protein
MVHRATLDTLPAELLCCLLRFLSLPDILRLAATAPTFRSGLLSVDADVAWQERTRCDFGPDAFLSASTASASPLSSAFALYRSVHEWRRDFDSLVEIVGGSIEMSCDGVDVVACPCLKTLQFFPSLVRVHLQLLWLRC